jgi:hypothetical protein
MVYTIIIISVLLLISVYLNYVSIKKLIALTDYHENFLKKMDFLARETSRYLEYNVISAAPEVQRWIGLVRFARAEFINALNQIEVMEIEFSEDENLSEEFKKVGEI